MIERDAAAGTPRVSVVVPTFRRPALLARCLDALLAQDVEPDDYEIVVADDGVDAETRARVARLSADSRVAVRYVAVGPTHGPAAARNCGWRAARAPIVAFTDDDTIPDPGWLRAGLAALANGAAGAWGRLVVPVPDPPTDYERDTAGLERGHFATANCLYRRDVLDAVGGFDERFTAAWREDSDLFFSVAELGLPLVRAENAVVVHPVRPAAFGVSLGQQRKARFNALLFKKHPTLYRQLVQPAPPWRYYAILAALGVAAFGAVAGRPRLAAAGAGAWGILTGQFCGQRLGGASRAPAHVAEMLVTSALIPPVAVYWRLRGAVEFRTFFL
jgi:glycosyltransferase involved in cell wall biosynthesis